MSKVFKVFFLSILMYLAVQNVYGQQVLKYEVTVAGFSIGEMTAIKTSNEKDIRYEINSHVSFWFFGKISVDYEIKSFYTEKQLTEARVKTKTNKGDFQSDVIWNKDRYDISATSYKYELDTVIKRPFFFSSAKLYFEEPILHEEMMAENYGFPTKIKKVKDYYEVDVNGNKNRFYYIDGKLDKAVMQHPIKNYLVKRTSP